MHTKLYSSGTFAKLCKVHKKTLFYYDEIDLFKPAVVKDNGYRYYSHEQIDNFSKIRALQSVGMSLTEIKNLLFKENFSSGMKTIERQKKRVRKKIEELLQLEDTLNHTLEELEHYKKVGEYTIFPASYPVHEVITELLSVTQPLQVNYINDGYHSGVKFSYNEQLDELTKQSIYQKKHNSYPAKTNHSTYIGIYFHSADNFVIQRAKEAISYLKANGFIIDNDIYIEDIASNFINYPNDNMPFKLVAKITKF